VLVERDESKIGFVQSISMLPEEARARENGASSTQGGLHGGV
jgi:hypothetical protein